MRSQLGAVFSSFLPSSNEFWNVATEVLPLLFFIAAGFALHWAPRDASTAAIQQAVLGTIWSTVLQHACSLIAHVGFRASARLSHSIWFIDYSGILLNFIWNTPPLVFAMAPSLEVFWPAWCLTNQLATALLMGGGLWLTCTSPLPRVTDADGAGVSFFTVFLRSPSAVALLLLTCGVSLLATALVPVFGCVAHRICFAVLPTLGVSLAVKILGFPERWIGKSEGAASGSATNADLSYSLFHSHSLWHLGVWAVQLLYYAFFVEVLSARALLDAADIASGTAVAAPAVSGKSSLTKLALLAGWE